MGGAIKRSLISAYFLLSAYFLTVQSYKRMRLTTRVYSSTICGVKKAISGMQKLMNFQLSTLKFKSTV